MQFIKFILLKCVLNLLLKNGLNILDSVIFIFIKVKFYNNITPDKYISNIVLFVNDPFINVTF